LRAHRSNGAITTSRTWIVVTAMRFRSLTPSARAADCICACRMSNHLGLPAEAPANDSASSTAPASDRAVARFRQVPRCTSGRPALMRWLRDHGNLACHGPPCARNSRRASAIVEAAELCACRDRSWASKPCVLSRSASKQASDCATVDPGPGEARPRCQPDGVDQRSITPRTR
jgi:hypothetical protein